jgi:PDZ domain-containing protein
VLVIALVVIVMLVVVADHIDLNYYVLTPGEAQPVGPLVRVPPAKAHPIDGPLLLTDVYESRVSLLSYLPDKLDGDAQMLTTTALLGPYTPPDELTAQGFLEMAQAQAAAKAAAFTRLGYHVPEHDAGTLVFSVVPGSPASPVLRVGQIVTAVDGTPTPGVCAFVGALHPFGPGDTVRLSVEKSTVTSNAIIKPGRTVVERVRLTRRPTSVGETSDAGCPGAPTPSRGYLGVEVETQQDFAYPFPVSIDTTEIGGPSAGLAMTLTIIDKLYSGHATGGRTVAATGTIDPQGDVGAVGGVAQKTIAVERAGATVFLVPPAEYATAESKDIPSLHVYKVSTLDQALAILRRMGGQVPPKPSRTTAKVPPG